MTTDISDISSSGEFSKEIHDFLLSIEEFIRGSAL